jgi:hypothetical protein
MDDYAPNVFSTSETPLFFQNYGRANLIHGSKKFCKQQFSWLKFSFIENLAALDCYASIEGTSAYQKTYQDKMDINYLFGDPFLANKSLNLDKIFIDSPQETY